MKILIEFTPDEFVRGAETGTLRALVEAVKAAEKRIETAAQAINKPIQSETIPATQMPIQTSTPNLGIIQTANPAEQPATIPQTATPPAAAPATPPVTVPPASPAAATAAPTAAPTAIPQYDFNQLASATMQLQQAGQNIFEIFAQFGIQALNQLPKERYAEYAAVLRQRGAKI